ncbi:DJ-1/PfpI family protein [Desulfosporosinus sp. SB140]|uniref:DJ-1/PfpI family protein n=1 Tax=Desulfosporosinus paludis TaxID=3115649 RepID=UPI003890A4DE
MKKVLLLLAKGFESYEASVFIDVMGWNFDDEDGTTKLVTCGLRKEVEGSWGIKILTDITVDQVVVSEYDALAIPGGSNKYGFYEDAYNEMFLDLIRAFHNEGKIVATICVAALPVGKSGILNGKNGTTYNMGNGTRQVQLREFGVNVVNKPIVVEGNIITSWNPSTAIDVALKLLELLTSRENADHIRKIMGFTK